MTGRERLKWARYDVLSKVVTLAALIGDIVWMFRSFHPAVDLSMAILVAGSGDRAITEILAGVKAANRWTIVLNAVVVVVWVVSIVPAISTGYVWPYLAGIAVYFLFGRPLLAFSRSPQFEQLERPDDIYKVFANTPHEE